MCTCAALAVAPRYNIRAVLPRLSRAPVGSPPGYKLLPQEVVFLCCISQGARLFRRQCYQPTFPPNLTYLPATLFTIKYITFSLRLSRAVLHSALNTISLLHLLNPVFETLFNIFSISFPRCVLHSIFLHFLTFPSTPFIVFIFLHIPRAGYLTKSLKLGDLTFCSLVT